MSTLNTLDGVYSSGVASNIYAEPGRLDLCYIYVPEAFSSAGVFTQNKFRAACVDHCEKLQKLGKTFKVIVINSGNANAATGKEGRNNVQAVADFTAEKLGVSPDEVAVASTGVIGKQLPIENVLRGLATLFETPHAKESEKISKAILTLDTVEKTVNVERDGIVISGVAKGAGMIAPNMATMLGFLVTNAKLEAGSLRKELKSAVDKSFNMISVDTDTSTNDLVLIQSTGSEEITGRQQVFSQLLEEACILLAKQIAADGEGAEKLIEVEVLRALTEDDAKTVAKSIVNSPLVKTAVHGADPNWGRIMMATGKNPNIDFDPKRVDVSLAGTCVFKQGAPTDFDREALAQEMKKDNVRIEVDLNAGSAAATAWGCDLTKKYVDINTEYN